MRFCRWNIAWVILKSLVSTRAFGVRFSKIQCDPRYRIVCFLSLFLSVLFSIFLLSFSLFLVSLFFVCLFMSSAHPKMKPYHVPFTYFVLVKCSLLMFHVTYLDNYYSKHFYSRTPFRQFLIIEISFCHEMTIMPLCLVKNEAWKNKYLVVCKPSL